MKLKPVFIFFALLLAGFNLVAGNELFVAYPIQPPIETLHLSDKKNLLVKNWELYFNQTLPVIGNNNNSVKVNNSLNLADSIDLSNYNGICWFRKKFKTDSSFRNKSITLEFHLIGAAEIYLNGKFIKQIGDVGSSAGTEDVVHVSDEYVNVVMNENETHDLLIRFSNHQLEGSYNNTGQKVFGVKVLMKETENVFFELKEKMMYSIAAFCFLIFFLSLSFVHFTIYLFNRSETGNIYYSGFCFFIALFITSFQASNFISNAIMLKYFSFFIIITPLFCFSILPYMFRSFFKMQIPKWYKLALIAGVLCLGSFLFSWDVIAYLLLLIVIFYGLIESIRNIIIAFKQRKEGVKIIGSGLVVFTIFVGTMLISSMIGGLHTDNEIGAILLIVFLVLSILSIPISLTLFLARGISLTNKSLANKLVEVEELSAKSLEQEKEKQQILADQNITLEKQVTERTHEIREQKKIIEEKNKDIIDSINYAKRIQSAMLPDEEAFKSIFDNSFVLYQPRDIVSGDFYYATELNGQKLIIAADCTGHGVPGALMSMVGCNIINKLTHENSIVEPKKVLETLHTELRRALKQDLKGSLNRDGMDLAAVLVTDKEIIYAGANRPMIWFNNNNELQELKPTKTPVGGSHIESIEVQQQILNKGEVKQFFLFSDGFADQFGGPDGKKLMVSKFKLWLSQIVGLSPAEQNTFLQKNFSDWKRESEQVDDVMVVGIKTS